MPPQYAFSRLVFAPSDSVPSSSASQGFCYINYSSVASAEAAMRFYHGLEYPAGSGYRLKVLYAEPLPASSYTDSLGGGSPLPASSPSPPVTRGASPLAGQRGHPGLGTFYDPAALHTLLPSDLCSLSLADLGQGQLLGGSSPVGNPPAPLGSENVIGGSPPAYINLPGISPRGAMPPQSLAPTQPLGGSPVEQLQQLMAQQA